VVPVIDALALLAVVSHVTPESAAALSPFVEKGVMFFASQV